MRTAFNLGWILLALGAAGTGCCLESVSGSARNSTGEPSVGATTGSGTAGGGTSSGGASSSGAISTGASFFVGAVEVETLTTIDPNSSAEPPILSMNGQFLPASEWPSCTSDSLVVQENACCFAAGTSTVPGLSAGALTLTLGVEPPSDGGGAQGSQETFLFNGKSGVYDSEGEIIPADAGPWFSTLWASGDVVPAFNVSIDGFPPPEPVVTPSLGQLGSLSTSQDWTIPLTPSELEFQFHDRVILEVDGVGSIICEVTDEGAFNPPLVVPAAQLANFTGHMGTVSIHRDEYTGLADAGSLLIGFRNGVAIRTSPGAVSFTP